MNLPNGVVSLGWQPFITVFIIGAIIAVGLTLLFLAARFIHLGVSKRINAKPKEPTRPIRNEWDVFRYTNRGYGWEKVDDGGSWWYPFWVSFVVTLLWLAITAIALIPYNQHYWSWYEVKGTVSSVEPVLAATDDGAMSTDYLVTIEGNSTIYWMDNPRIRDFEGDDVTLLCSAAWSDAGYSQDRWGCSIRVTD